MNPFAQQKVFMEACGQTTDFYNEHQFELYKRLIHEEVEELNTATSPVEQLDALVDILVVTIGAMHSLGVNANGAWDEVMKTNFAKVDWSTKKVIKRADGKVLKPEGWQPPQLDKFVLPRQ